MTKIENIEQYEWALSRVEQLLPLVDDNTPRSNPNSIELELLSNLVADYSEEALFEYLKSRIDDNRMPRKIEAIDEIPRTYNGKIQRKKLMQ